jgi:hypothetical protein
MNQLMLKSCVHSWDPKQCLQLLNTKSSCPVENWTRTIVNIVWDPKNVRSILTLIGS